MPDGVAVQQLLLVGVGALGDGRAIQRSSRAICSSRGGSVPMATRTLRRCSSGLPAGSSSRAAWVSGRRRRPSSRRIAGAALLSSQLSDGGRAVPCRRGCRRGPAVAGGSRRPGRRAGHAAAAAAAQRAHRPAVDAGRAARSPGSCARSRGRGGCRSSTAARRRCRRGPARSARSRAHRAQRCLHARHHGLPVALEITHGACVPQIEQVSDLPRPAGRA